MYKTIDPQEISTGRLHHYLLGAIAPRPIAFASTIDKAGNINLSPFSFFNVFGSNPPVLIFSSARRVRDNTLKHTLENMLEVPEVVINIVNFSIVEQMSLASTEYEKSVNEFIKSGLTPLPSTKISPPRVAESPASFECVVKQIIETGQEGGAGNLVVCHVVLAHIKTEILDEKEAIDPFKLDAVARMGGDWYCRANGNALFEIPKPNLKKGIGFDQLPKNILEGQILTGNNLGRLANIEQIPSQALIDQHKAEDKLFQEICLKFKDSPQALTEALHQLAQKYLTENKLDEAWAVLL